MPVIRSICEAYMCLPDSVGKLTLDQALFLCIKRGLLIRSNEPGWSFDGNVAAMTAEAAKAKGVRGLPRKPRGMSYYQHVKQQSAKKRNGR